MTGISRTKATRCGSLALLLAAASIAAGAFATAAQAVNPEPIASLTGESISGADHTQTNRLSRDGTASSCAVPHTQTLLVTSPVHYRQYDYFNAVDQPTCVTVSINTACSAGNAIYSAAYSSYNPNDPSQNQLGVEGGSPPSITSYSFEVPARSDFGVVVHEVAANTGCSSYDLSLTGDHPVATSGPGFAGRGTGQQVFVGQTLHLETAQWTASPTVTQQWMRCDGMGANCHPISGVTGSTFTPAVSDIGSTFKVVQTANDASGTATATSQATGPTVAAPPAPVYSVSSHGGAALDPTPTAIGLNTDDATKTLSLPFPVSFYGQSYGSVAVGGNGNLQFGPANTAYSDPCVPSDDFAGPTLFAFQRDLLTNAAGQPGEGVFSGLSGTPGSRVFDLRWVAENISDHMPDTFQVRLYEGSQRISVIYGVITDLGAKGTVGVQASPLAGGTQFSCDSPVLTKGTEVDFDPQLPTVSGALTPGSALTLTNAAWHGTAPIAFADQWQRCDGGGAGCTSIPGATGPTYTLTSADLGSTLRAVVTANNLGGTASLSSAPTGVVAAPVTPPAPPKPQPLAQLGHLGVAAFVASAGLPTFDGHAIDETVSCGGTAGACTGVLAATMPGTTAKARATAAKHAKKPKRKKAATVTAASGVFSIPAGHSQTVKALLTGAAARRLAAKHTLTVTVTVAVRNAAGRLVTISTHKLTLHAPKAKHRKHKH